MTHHYAGVELVEALHGAIAEAVTQVFLDKVGVVQDVVSHQRLLPSKRQGDKMRNERKINRKRGGKKKLTAIIKGYIKCFFYICISVPGSLPCA